MGPPHHPPGLPLVSKWPHPFLCCSGQKLGVVLDSSLTPTSHFGNSCHLSAKIVMESTHFRPVLPSHIYLSPGQVQ